MGCRVYTRFPKKGLGLFLWGSGRGLGRARLEFGARESFHVERDRWSKVLVVRVSRVFHVERARGVRMAGLSWVFDVECCGWTTRRQGKVVRVFHVEHRHGRSASLLSTLRASRQCSLRG